LAGRLMVKTLVMGADSDFSSMADMIAVCSFEDRGRPRLCDEGSVIQIRGCWRIRGCGEANCSGANEIESSQLIS
jgi:hypothetical protein